MSRELTLNLNLAYSDAAGLADSLGVVDSIFSVTTPKMVKSKLTALITETAVPLSGIASPQYLVLVNLDSVNFVNVKTGTGGTIFAKLLPGYALLVPLGSGALAPYVIADTASVDLAVMIVSA